MALIRIGNTRIPHGEKGPNMTTTAQSHAIARFLPLSPTPLPQGERGLSTDLDSRVGVWR
jgi:hypothetical protein